MMPGIFDDLMRAVTAPRSSSIYNIKGSIFSFSDRKLKLRITPMMWYFFMVLAILSFGVYINWSSGLVKPSCLAAASLIINAAVSVPISFEKFLPAIILIPSVGKYFSSAGHILLNIDCFWSKVGVLKIALLFP